MGQHQVAVAQHAPRGAQLAGVGADAHGMGVGQQGDAQAVRRIAAGFGHQGQRVQLARHGHRQQRLVVPVASAGRHQGDGQRGVVLAQRLGQLPARTAGADDDHARLATRADVGRGRCAGLRPQRLQRGGFVRRKIGLGHPAQGAGPVVRNVCQPCAGWQPSIGVAVGLVVDVAAGVADVALPGRLCCCVGQRVVDGLRGGAQREGVDCRRRGGGCGGRHAGISSVLSRAISLRRCLMAGVTMATKCDSRTRRCTSELMR